MSIIRRITTKQALTQREHNYKMENVTQMHQQELEHNYSEMEFILFHISGIATFKNQIIFSTWCERHTLLVAAQTAASS